MPQDSASAIPFPKPLTDDPRDSYTLPSGYYTDPAVFELEKERIFFRTWSYACHVSQVRSPGDFVAFRLVDQPLFVVRDGDGNLRAFHNVCQHRAHELVRGSGNLKAVITCPYHAWAYGLDGSLRSARKCEAVRGFDKSEFGLRPVRLEVLCDMVFVNLDDGAAPLHELAPRLESEIRENLPYWDDLELAEVFDFGGAANEAGWKVVVDNYLECYHCEAAHPQFVDLIEMPTYEHIVDGITARQKGHDVRLVNSAYPIAPDARMPHSIFWYLWPTTTINVMPGMGDLLIMQIIPEGPFRTRFTSSRFAPPGTPNDPVRRNYFENVVGFEDLQLCESTQRGLFSRGYDQGRLMVDDALGGEGEHAVHFFHKMVRDALAS